MEDLPVGLKCWWSSLAIQLVEAQMNSWLCCDVTNYSKLRLVTVHRAGLDSDRFRTSAFKLSDGQCSFRWYHQNSVWCSLFVWIFPNLQCRINKQGDSLAEMSNEPIGSGPNAWYHSWQPGIKRLLSTLIASLPLFHHTPDPFNARWRTTME